MPETTSTDSNKKTKKEVKESTISFDPLTYKDKSEKKGSSILCEQILVKTTSDGKIHKYFSDFEMNYDVDFAVAPGTLTCGKTDDEMIKYWTNNDDYVTVYSGYVDENNDDKLIEVFYGKVSMVKQVGYKLEIQIDNIGRRFKQKIPDEFRTAFIYNQNVRDAFQAICEFIGVHFVCPPHLEDDATASTGTDTTTGDNTATTNINTENGIAGSATTNSKTTNSNTKTTNSNTNSNLKGSGNTASTDSNSDEATDENTEATEGSEDQITEQVGYKNITFDASGAICKSGTKIEENPDTIKQTTVLTDLPFNLYAKEYEEYLKAKKEAEESGTDSSTDTTGTNSKISTSNTKTKSKTSSDFFAGFTGTLKTTLTGSGNTAGNSTNKTTSINTPASNQLASSTKSASDANSKTSSTNSAEQKAEEVTQNAKEPEYPSVEDIHEDLLKYLKGENFDELHDEIMDYDAITITPKSSGDTASTTTPTTATGTAATAGATGITGTTGTTSNTSNKSSSKKSSSNKSISNKNYASTVLSNLTGFRLIK
jgi:hypothetical protein